MVLPLVLKLALLTQAPVLSAAAAHAAPTINAASVRVWLSDSKFQVGARARVFVNLRDPGYLVVLHADAAGRVRVLFPRSPDESAQAPAGATLEVAASNDRAAFVVPAGSGVGTVVAVRSRTPFEFDELRDADGWDYANALLFQPTAGNPLAALLDIADRMAGGARYQYDMAEYRTPQTAAMLAFQDEVPWSGSGSGSYYPDQPAAPPAATVVEQTNSVDCSNANLVDSFCGVIDNHVTNIYQQQAEPAPAPAYVPYYIPFFVPRRHRFSRDSQPPRPQPAIALAVNLRALRTTMVPPRQREPAPIRVRQPYAPSHLSPPEQEAPPASPRVQIISNMPMGTASAESATPGRVMLVHSVPAGVAVWRGAAAGEPPTAAAPQEVTGSSSSGTSAFARPVPLRVGGTVPYRGAVRHR
ncbi:MAG: hypothetical protein DMD71_10865 [Gemmatimonadetes bacterium]|nr:MAG: hypothetical protein DMD71_10865 [Gemmatimonadota bacterium]